MMQVIETAPKVYKVTINTRGWNRPNHREFYYDFNTMLFSMDKDFTPGPGTRVIEPHQIEWFNKYSLPHAVKDY